MEILSKRGLKIAHPRAFKNTMQSDTYYHMINGYKHPFLAGTDPELYFAGTTFEQICALYEFDQKIRSLFLIELLKIEKKIKTLIAYHFSKKYGHDDRKYLDIINFNDSTLENRNSVISLIQKIKEDIALYKKRGQSAILHYLSKYGYIPLWVLSTIMTFGRITHFYDYMKLADQQEVAINFKLSVAKLKGFLSFLTSVRNRCAHGERIYTPDRNSKFLRLIPDTEYHKLIGIPKNSKGNYIRGKTDVTAILIAFKVFLKKSDFNCIKKKFINFEKSLEKKLPLSIMSRIDKTMGHPIECLKVL